MSFSPTNSKSYDWHRSIPSVTQNTSYPIIAHHLFQIQLVGGASKPTTWLAMLWPPHVPASIYFVSLVTSTEVFIWTSRLQDTLRDVSDIQEQFPHHLTSPLRPLWHLSYCCACTGLSFFFTTIQFLISVWLLCEVFINPFRTFLPFSSFRSLSSLLFKSSTGRTRMHNECPQFLLFVWWQFCSFVTVTVQYHSPLHCLVFDYR